MDEYLQLLEDVLVDGTHKENRTGVDTISSFSHSYTIDLQEGFPLLTTKKMDRFRWDSLIHEVIWYLSGQEHIRELREETKIWDAWATEEGHLETAYGRFWRRFPVPDEESHLPGEAWADADCQWVTEEDDGSLVFDQVQYVIDTLNGDNPQKGPESRRMVISAWHPANATVSGLPPCHYTFVFNVQGDDTLNVHLTQRSGDIALGVPFNIAAYSLLAKAIAQRTGYELGEFGHTIVDAHAYCGDGERGEWYAENLDTIQTQLQVSNSRRRGQQFKHVREYIEENAPEGNNDPRGNPYDHVPGLLRQMDRLPKGRGRLEIADKPLDELEFGDIVLKEYQSEDGLSFGVAE